MRKIINEKYEVIQKGKDAIVFKLENNNKKFLGYLENVNLSEIKNIGIREQEED